MRKKYFASPILCLLLLVNTAFAQKLVVEERPVKNEETVDLDSWTASLDQDMDYCMETYSDFIKELVKVKVDKRGKSILVAQKTAFPELSDLRMDQRAIFTTESSGTAVSFTFSPGYDIHFSREAYKSEFAKGEAFIKSYVRFHYKVFYEEKRKDIENKIKSKQNDIESNNKKTEKNTKAITENAGAAETDKSKSKNEKMQRENDGYASDTTSKRREITDLQDELSSITQSLKKVEEFR